MNNQTLYTLIAIVGLGVVVLLAFNFSDLLMNESPNQDYLKYHEVRGIAVNHDNKLYTLSYKQQNTFIDILNLSVPLNEIPHPMPLSIAIDRIIVYSFEGKPDIVLTPVSISEKNIVFSAPDFIPEGHHYLMELSEGDLATLLSQTYD